MPLAINEETPRVGRTIAGFNVTVPSPYLPGHPLTDGEAKQMNQVLAENISNNLRKKLDDGKIVGEGDAEENVPYTVEEAQALVDQYMQTYEPGVRTASGEPRVTDPVEREARKIARAKAVELVKQHGMKAKDVDLTPIVDQIFDLNKDVLMKEAKKIVAAQEAAKKQSDAISLDGINLAAPAEGEAAEPAPVA